MEEESVSSSESKEMIKPKLNRFAKEFIPTKPISTHIPNVAMEVFGDYSPDDEFPSIHPSLQNETSIKKKKRKHKKKIQIENESEKPSYASVLKLAVKPLETITIEPDSIIATNNSNISTQSNHTTPQIANTASSSSTKSEKKEHKKVKQSHKKKTKNQITASSNLFAKQIRSAPIQPKPQNTVIFKGKQREVKRRKKISKLKRLVLEQRHQKLQDHGVDAGYASDICSLFPSSSNIAWGDATDDMIPNYFSDDGMDKKQLIKEEPKPRQPKKLEIRSYVNHDISRALNMVCSALILKLKFFQKRLKIKEPLKYESRKKFCVGLRETLKGVKAQTIKAILMAPNIEDVQVLNNNYITPILQLAAQHNVKVIFCLSKRKFGKLFKKPMASCIGVYRVDPANDEYKSILTLWKGLREKFDQSEEKQAKCLYL